MIIDRHTEQYIKKTGKVRLVVVVVVTVTI